FSVIGPAQITRFMAKIRPRVARPPCNEVQGWLARALSRPCKGGRQTERERNPRAAWHYLPRAQQKAPRPERPRGVEGAAFDRQLARLGRSRFRARLALGGQEALGALEGLAPCAQGRALRAPAGGGAKLPRLPLVLL